MKIPPEDPRLISYQLGELDQRESAIIAQALASDPTLQRSFAEMTEVSEQLKTTLQSPPLEQLLPSQRREILLAARQNSSVSQFPPVQRSRKLTIAFAAAAAIALGGFVISRYRPATQPATTATSTRQLAAEPSTAIAKTATVSDDTRIASSGHQMILAATHPALPLPILTASSHLAELALTIRNTQQLPPPVSVRIENLLNAFPIRLNGITAVARAHKSNWHPDPRADGITSHTATLTSETMPCPWHPSATLLLISIRGNADHACEVEAQFRPNPAVVSNYRILGFSPITETSKSETNNRLLSANSQSTLALEVETTATIGQLGIVSWTVDQQAAATVSISRNPATEPSDDARFASLVCSYGMWLVGEQKMIIDPPLLAALSREINSASLPAARVDFLKLVEQSLLLENR